MFLFRDDFSIGKKTTLEQMGDFETRKNCSRRLIITNTSKKRREVKRKISENLDHLVFKDKQNQGGVDQTKIKQSEKSSACNGI